MCRSAVSEPPEQEDHRADPQRQKDDNRHHDEGLEGQLPESAAVREEQQGDTPQADRAQKQDPDPLQAALHTIRSFHSPVLFLWSEIMFNINLSITDNKIKPPIHCSRNAEHLKLHF